MEVRPEMTKFGHTKWKSRSVAIGLATTLALATGLAGVATASATTKKTVVKKKAAAPKLTSANLSLQINVPVGGALGPYLVDWINSVKTKSKGKIVITPYYQGALYTNVTSVPAVQSGALDLNLIDFGSLDNTMPQFEAAILPLTGADASQLEEYTGPTSPVWNALSIFSGTHSLFLFPTPALIPGDQSIMLKAPINALSGLSGQSIRSLGGLFDTILQGLGADPVDLSSSAVPTALQTGTISGAFGSLSVMTTTWKGLGNTDVDLGSISPGSYYMVANKGVWGKLSKADRTFLTTSYEATFNSVKPFIGAIQKNAEALWTSTTGNTVYTLNASDKASLKPILKGIWTSYQSQYPTFYKAAEQAIKKFKLSAYAPS